MASLAIAYLIVFEAGFARQQQRRRQEGLFQRPLTETAAAYLVSLLTGALMLAFFDNLDTSASLVASLKATVVLGLPAAIGGAAGRRAI